MEPTEPPLPRPPADEENLRRLRQEAVERMRRDEMREVRPAYGGPPIVTRRWTVRGIAALLGAAVAFDHGVFRLIEEPAEAPWPEDDAYRFRAESIQWTRPERKPAALLPVLR